MANPKNPQIAENARRLHESSQAKSKTNTGNKMPDPKLEGTAGAVMPIPKLPRGQ